MKRLKKIILWILIIAVAIVIVLAAGIMLFFPKEKFKSMAVEKISATLGREVAVDGISVSLLGGIGAYLEGIRIANPPEFEKDYFLDARALDIKLRLWPLLKRQVLVDRLILVEPKIALHKLEDGTVNYRFGAIDSLAPPAVKEKLPEESKLAVSAVSFENLAIKDGKCDFVDDSLKMNITAVNINLDSKLKTPEAMIYNAFGEIEVESLLVTSDAMSLPPLRVAMTYNVTYNRMEDKVILATSDFILNGVKLQIQGDIPEFSSLDYANMQMVSEKVNIADLITLLPEEYRVLLADYTIDGNVTLNATVKYDCTAKDTLQYDGKLNLSDVRLSSKEVAGELSINTAIADFRKDFVKLDIQQATLADNPFKAEVSAAGFDNPDIEGKASGSIDLTSLNAYLPETGKPNLSGAASFEMDFKGPAKEPGRMALSGRLSVRDAAYTATTLPEPVESFSLDASIDSRDMIINDMRVVFPSSDIALKGRLSDAFPYFVPGYEKKARKPYLKFNLTSQRFDVDRLFPEVAPGEGVDLAEMSPDSLPVILLPDINGSGTGVVDTLIYSRVEFTDITGNIRIKDRIIYVDSAEGNVYSGRVTGESQIDLNDFENPKYSGRYSASKIEANDFLTRFTKFGGHLFGKLNMDGSFSASGWEPEDLISSLTMDGQALFGQAKLVNFDLLKELGQKLNFKTFGEETINDLASSFRVKDGRVEFDALKFLSSFGDWNITGSVGFDGTLDYSGEILLSEKISNDLLSKSGLVSGLAGLFKEGKTGRVNVPFRLSGMYAKPKVSVDFSAREKIQEEMKDKLGDAIKNLFKKD